ncbi:MAG TPA: hypothetical protein GXZ49_01015 [Bacteroidetes bacterium]|nr:hypothetical protein [Bacteroidota bacterium]
MKFMGCSVAFEEQCCVDVTANRNRLMKGANWFKNGFTVSLLKTGKRLLLAVMFMALSGAMSAQTIYYWIGGTSGNYNDGNNWSTTVGGSAVGSNPGTNNSIVFVVDGADISSAPGLQTGNVTIRLPNNNMKNGGWRIVNNANVTLNHSSTNNARGLTLDDQTGIELLVETGCVLDVSYMWRIILSNNSSSEINGELIINGNTYTWNNNSVMVTVNGTITNTGALISSSTSTLRFNPSSVYNHDRYGGAIPTAVWDATSTVNVNKISNATLAGFNQTFGNLNLNGADITWNRIVSLSGHTVVQGNFYIRGSSPRTLTLLTGDFNFTVNGTTTIDNYGVINDDNINRLNRFDGLVTIAPNGSFNVSPGVSEFRGGNNKQRYIY